VYVHFDNPVFFSQNVKRNNELARSVMRISRLSAHLYNIRVIRRAEIGNPCESGNKSVRSEIRTLC
jgi:hypothetical protein